MMTVRDTCRMVRKYAREHASLRGVWFEEGCLIPTVKCGVQSLPACGTIDEGTWSRISGVGYVRWNQPCDIFTKRESEGKQVEVTGRSSLIERVSLGIAQSRCNQPCKTGLIPYSGWNSHRKQTFQSVGNLWVNKELQRAHVSCIVVSGHRIANSSYMLVAVNLRSTQVPQSINLQTLNPESSILCNQYTTSRPK